jgi:hypothetical protein
MRGEELQGSFELLLGSVHMDAGRERGRGSRNIVKYNASQ